MKKFLAKRRFEVLALSISLVCALIHRASDNTPVVDDYTAQQPSLIRSFLRGVITLESRATDFQFQLRGEKKPHPDVVVVAIDEKAAQDFGLWPWPRDFTGKALAKLAEYQPRAIGLDMFFSDSVEDKAAIAYKEALSELDKELATKPELSVQLTSYKERLSQKSSRSPDEALAASLGGIPFMVQGAYAYTPVEAKQFTGLVAEHNELVKPHLVPPEYVNAQGAVEEWPINKIHAFSMFSAVSSRPVIAKAAKRMGHINTAPDPDGGLRRTPIFAKLEGAGGFLPSLELAVASAYYGANVRAAFDKDTRTLIGADIVNKDNVTITRVPIPDTEPLTYINHIGSAKAFTTVSFSDVMKDGIDPELKSKLAGKAALVGVTLTGNFDQRVTPFNKLEPGIYTHASFLSNILSRDYLTRPWWFVLVEMLYMLAAGATLAIVIPRVPFQYKAGLVVLLVVGWLAADQLLFSKGSLLATVMPTLSVFLTGFAVVFLGYLSADREKGQIRNVFQHYVDKRVMDQMLNHPEKLRLGGDKKDMTVLFSDIRGFTTLAERMTPSALVDFINEYLTPMTDIVFEYQGTLDKYIGDAVMCFWGAPVEQSDHALRACQAAMKMLEKLEELKKGWRERNLPDISIGVGINSGPMTAGNMGSHGRFNYTVMGDAVNLASRLEGTNKEYETNVLISEATYLQVQTDVVARRLGAVRVKGKRKPVRIYELRRMGQPEGVEKEAIQAFEQAVDAYAERKWDEAETLFNAVLKAWPGDAPSQRYLEEIAVFRETPPGPRWDGVYTATTK